MGIVEYSMPPTSCRIGGTIVEVSVRGHLPAQLSHLTALPERSETSSVVRLSIEILGVRDWGLASSHEQGIYEMGRPSHHVYLDCGSGDVRFRVPSDMDENDLYWIQRDLFACLGSLSTDPLLHSSAVVHEGEGYIFCASSGIGKSTVARLLSKHASVVNDETNWITRDPSSGSYALVNQPFWLGAIQKGIGYTRQGRNGRGDATAPGTIEPATLERPRVSRRSLPTKADPRGPFLDGLWLGEAGTVPFVPVAGIYLLERAESCSVSACALNADVFSMLLAVHLPLDSRDPFLPARSMNIVLMSREIALKKLHFRRDVRELEEVLYGG